MSLPGAAAHTAGVFIPIPEVHSKMPQALIVIFLLFFAVLAFAWFYWQRAKARDAAKTTADTSASAESAASVEQTDPAR